MCDCTTTPCAVPGKLASFAAPSQRMIRRLADGTRVYVRVLVQDDDDGDGEVRDAW
jgi:hypothetical protein